MVALLTILAPAVLFGAVPVLLNFSGEANGALVIVFAVLGALFGLLLVFCWCFAQAIEETEEKRIRKVIEEMKKP